MGDFVYEEQGYILNTNNNTNIYKTLPRPAIIAIVFISYLIFSYFIIHCCKKIKSFRNGERERERDLVQEEQEHPTVRVRRENRMTNPINTGIEYNQIRDIIETVDILMNNNREHTIMVKLQNYTIPGEYITSNVNKDNCPICIFENNTKSIKLNNCSHIFHSECIKTCIIHNIKNNTKSLCPICRTPVY